MKKFEAPEIKVVEFEVEDVLTASGEPDMTFMIIDGEPCIS